MAIIDKQIIYKIYQIIFDEEFSYNSFEQRLKMQKMVYILKSMNLNMGNYNFSWYKFGPYSQELHDDAYLMSTVDPDVNFTAAAETAFKQFKDIMSVEHKQYSDKDWLETISSLIYLNKNRYLEGSELINELVLRKPHLKENDLNLKALNLLIELKLINNLEKRQN